MGTPTAISLGTPTAISLKSYQGWLQSSFQIHLKCKDILFCRIMTKYELRMTKIELNYWNFKKMPIWVHFMIISKLKNRWILIYLNVLRQKQVKRGLEFICKISGLPCQEPALFKRFWSLICDNLTISDQNNSFELAAIQNNWNCLRIKINLLHSE